MAERQFTYKLKFEADRNSYEQINKELTDLEKMATTAFNQKGHILSETWLNVGMIINLIISLALMIYVLIV